MAWDATKPANDTKIRLYPTTLQANFNAIETGDSSLKYDALNIQEQGSDPSRIDDCMIIYSKQDGAGETELFVLDDQNPANAIQMTEIGYLGSQSTSLGMSQFSFDGGTTVFNKNNIVDVYGRIDSSGNLTYGSGISGVVRNSAGNYTVTLDTNYVRDSTNYVVSATTNDSTRRGPIQVNILSTSTFDILGFAFTGVSQDFAVMFTVIGGWS